MVLWPDIDKIQPDLIHVVLDIEVWVGMDSYFDHYSTLPPLLDHFDLVREAEWGKGKRRKDIFPPSFFHLPCIHVLYACMSACIYLHWGLDIYMLVLLTKDLQVSIRSLLNLLWLKWIRPYLNCFCFPARMCLVHEHTTRLASTGFGLSWYFSSYNADWPHIRPKEPVLAARVYH